MYLRLVIPMTKKPIKTLTKLRLLRIDHEDSKYIGISVVGVADIELDMADVRLGNFALVAILSDSGLIHFARWHFFTYGSCKSYSSGQLTSIYQCPSMKASFSCVLGAA